MKVFNSADLNPITVIVTAIQALLTTVAASVANILAVTNVMPILEETGGTFTTDGTVQNLYINNAPTGVYRPINIEIDFSNQTATETVTLRTYYRILAGGALILQDELDFTGVIHPEKVTIDLDPNRFGIQTTLERTAGNAKAYTWEVFYEVAP